MNEAEKRAQRGRDLKDLAANVKGQIEILTERAQRMQAAYATANTERASSLAALAVRVGQGEKVSEKEITQLAQQHAWLEVYALASATAKEELSAAQQQHAGLQAQLNSM